MKFTEICIKRPVFATVLSLIIIVMGLLGYMSLTTRYLPNVSEYYINISTNYTGASAKLIESTVNTPIEDAVSTISGINNLRSSATPGTGTVTIKFKPDIDYAEKANEVRDKLAEIRGDLPAGIDTPTIDMADNNGFLMDIALTDPNMTPGQMRDYARRYIVDQFQEIAGVANVYTWGAANYAMRIWLNPAKMAARNITVEDVQQALKNNNVRMPAGEFKSTTMNFPVTENTQLHSIKQFNDLVIAVRNGHVIRVSDIGQAKIGFDVEPVIARLNHEPTIDLGVTLQSGANPIAVSAAVKKQMRLVASTLPHGMKMVSSFNIATFFKASVNEVYLSIILAILCVVLVIYLFLGSLRSAIIPIVTIPICVIGTFAIISALGFTLNILTLLAIVLAIGLVVDDAVVVLENIHRYLEQGLTPKKAAITGSRQIVFAVIAMSLTLVAVYAPIGFMHTRSALMFREFAFTLAAAVLISGFVALTLTPSLCALLLRHQDEDKGYIKHLNRFFPWLSQQYSRILRFALKRRLWIAGICGVLLISGYFIWQDLGHMFLPAEDMNMVMAIVAAPPGSNVNYTSKGVDAAQKIMEAILQAKRTFTVVGNDGDENGRVNLFLTPAESRKVSAQQIAAQLNTKLKNIPDAKVYAFALSPYVSGKQHGVHLHIMTSGSYAHLYQVTQMMLKKLKSYKGFSDVTDTMKFDSQQYNVTVKRNLAATLQVPVASIDQTLATLLGGSYITNYYVGDQSYKVMVQASKNNLTNPRVINQFYVRNKNNKLIPLANLISVKPIIAEPNMRHFSRLRSAEFQGQVAPGYSLSQVVSYLQQNMTQWLPQDVRYAFSGKALRMLEGSQSMNDIFIFALIFIFLVLAAQFESFVDPFIVLLTVPLCLVSALAVLALIGGTLNLYTYIGLVTLVGLISKHGILITSFANELQQQGKDVYTAVIEATAVRLRPILMTTAAMILGALPLVIAQGPGSNSRHQLGWVIIAGMLFGTFFSLIVVPVAYTFLAKLKKIKVTSQQKNQVEVL